MEVEQLFDLGQWILLLGGLVSPPVLSLVKNVGRFWSDRTKTVVAVGFAVVGALVAYAVNVDLSAISLTDWTGVWLPLAAGTIGMIGTQYASFKVLWSGALAPIESALAGAGAPKNPGE